MNTRSTALALVLLCGLSATQAFMAPAGALQAKARPALSSPRMSLDTATSVLDVVSQTEAMGLSVTAGAYAATILGLFIPVVFLVTLYIQTAANQEDAVFRDLGDPSTRYKNLEEFRAKRGLDPY